MRLHHLALHRGLVAGIVLALSFQPVLAGTLIYKANVPGLKGPPPPWGAQSPQQPNTPAAPARLVFEPISLALGSVEVGQSVQGTATLRNLGEVTATGLSVAEVAAPFTHSSTCGNALPGGASCSVSVTFSATVAGSFQTQITTRATESAATLSVSAIGIPVAAPEVTLSTSALQFENQRLATTSSVSSITVKNTGNATLAFSSVGVSTGETDFGQSNDCATVVAGGSCTVEVAFTPRAVGARAGTVTLTTTGGEMHHVALGGTGTQPVAEFSTSALTFLAQTMGASEARTVTISNTGNEPLTIQSAVLSGNTAEFRISQGCPSIIAPGASCQLSIAFTPTGYDARAAASLTVTHNGAGPSGAVTLLGTGPQSAPVLSVDHTSLSFGDQRNGTQSIAQPLTLTNTGSAPLRLTGISISQGEASFGQSNSCEIVEVGESCIVHVGFSPTVNGPLAGTLTLLHNAGEAFHIALSGTGVQSVASVTTPLVLSSPDIGTTVEGIITVSNTGTAPLNISSMTTVVANPELVLLNGCTAPVQVAGTCNITVRFTPTGYDDRQPVQVNLTHDGATGSSTILIRPYGPVGVPKIELSDTFLDFGSRKIGEPDVVRSLTITNAGTRELRISSYSNLVPSGVDGFSAVNPESCAFIEAGASCVLQIKLHSNATNGTSSYSSYMLINHSASDEPAYVGMMGVVTDPTPVIVGAVSASPLNDEMQTLTFTFEAYNLSEGLPVVFTYVNYAGVVQDSCYGQLLVPDINTCSIVVVAPKSSFVEAIINFPVAPRQASVLYNPYL